MSLLHRVIANHHAVDPAEPPAPTLPLRMTFAASAFAQLVTDPPEAADDAYAVYVQREMTPGIAEREVALALAEAAVACPPVESLESYSFELQRERTDSGRSRLFARYLVRLQYNHEANMRTLRALQRAPDVRRVAILPGCCPVCDALAKRNYRLSHPPILPVEGCVRHGGCVCGYVPVIE